MDEKELKLQEDQIRNLEFAMTAELELISIKLIEQVLDYAKHSKRLTMCRDSNQYIDMNLKILSALWAKLNDDMDIAREDLDNLLTGCDLTQTICDQIEELLILD